MPVIYSVGVNHIVILGKVVLPHRFQVLKLKNYELQCSKNALYIY